MSRYTQNLNNGALLPSAYQSLNKVTFGENVQMVWYTQFQNGPFYMASVLEFTPTDDSLNVNLPDATQNSEGFSCLIKSFGTDSFDLNDFNGTTIATIAAGDLLVLWLDDNTTQAGGWQIGPFGGGVSGVVSIGAQAANAITTANLTINPGAPITSTGTFTFAFAGDLLELISFDTASGIPVRNYNGGDPQWLLRTIAGTTNQIQISNASGVAGNPTLSLANNITGIGSAQIGNLLIGTNGGSGGSNAITAIAGTDIELRPQAGGQTFSSLPIAVRANQPIRFYDSETPTPRYVALQAGDMTALGANLTLVLPKTAPVDGQVMAVNVSGGTNQIVFASSPTFPGTSIVNSIPKYTNSSGALGTTTVLLDFSNNMTGLNSAAIQNIGIATTGANIISTLAGNLILTPAAGSAVQFNSAATVMTGNNLLCQNISNTAAYGFTASSLGGTGNTVWTLPPLDGTNKAIMRSTGATALNFSKTAATTTSGVTTDFIPQVIVKFNAIVSPGSGTTVVTLDMGFNIASVVKTPSAGVYTVTFSSAIFASTTYMAMGSFSNTVGGSSTAGSTPGTIVSSGKTTSSCTITLNGVTNVANDMVGAAVQIVFFGATP